MSLIVPARLRGLPRPVWILLAGTLITRAGSFVIPFLSIYLIRERGLSSSFAGIALSSYGAGAMVASLVGGALTDRLGRRVVLVLSPTLGGAATLVLYFGQQPATVVAMSFVAGVVSEATRPAVSAMLADLVPIERRLDAFVLWRIVINLGFTIGTTLGGLLVRFGFGKLFIADAATTWAYALVVLLLVPESRPVPEPGDDPAELRGSFRDVLADPLFRRLWLATLLTAMVYAQPMTTMAIALTTRGLSPATFGTLIALNGAIILVAEFWLTGRIRRLPAPLVMATGALLLGYGYGLTGGVGRSIPLLVWSVFVWTTGEMIHAPMSATYLAGIAPPHLRGRYAGAHGFAWSVAFTLGPALGAFALDKDDRFMWYGVLVFGALAAAVYSTLPAGRPTPGAAPGR